MQYILWLSSCLSIIGQAELTPRACILDVAYQKAAPGAKSDVYDWCCWCRSGGEFWHGGVQTSITVTNDRRLLSTLTHCISLSASLCLSVCLSVCLWISVAVFRSDAPSTWQLLSLDLLRVVWSMHYVFNTILFCVNTEPILSLLTALRC